MSHPTANFNNSLAKQSEEIRVLGQTGQTVVYLFPDGRAFAEREEPDFDAFETPMPESEISENQILDELVLQGKLTHAQKSVVLHDCDLTGMTMSEILAARGWM